MSCLRTCCFAIAALKQNPALFLQNRNEHLNKIKQSYTCTHATITHRTTSCRTRCLLNRFPNFFPYNFISPLFFHSLSSGIWNYVQVSCTNIHVLCLFVPIPLRTTSSNVFHFLCVFLQSCKKKIKRQGEKEKEGERERRGSENELLTKNMYANKFQFSVFSVRSEIVRD